MQTCPSQVPPHFHLNQCQRPVQIKLFLPYSNLDLSHLEVLLLLLHRYTLHHLLKLSLQLFLELFGNIFAPTSQ